MKLNIIDLILKHAPDIFTGANCVGVVATAVLTGKAAVQAKEVIDKEILYRREQNGDMVDELTFKEKVGLTWKKFVVPTVVGTATVAASVASNRISAARLAEAIAIGSLYADRVKILEKKIEDKYGKEELIKTKNDIKNEELCEMPDKNYNKMLCYEPVSKQWFHATLPDILMAELTANKIFKDRHEISLNQWLKLLPECKTRSIWNDVGWWETDDEGVADDNWSYYKGAPWVDIQPRIREKNGKRYLELEYGMWPMEQYDNNIVRSNSAITNK